MFRRQLLAKVTSALSGESAGNGGGDSHDLREAFSVTMEFDDGGLAPDLCAVWLNSASLLRLDTVLWPLRTPGVAGPDVGGKAEGGSAPTARPGAAHHDEQFGEGAPVLRITIIERQSPDGPPTSRGISNIKELVAELQELEYGAGRSSSAHGSAGEAIGGTQVQVVRLDRLAITEQFNIMRYTDVLIGVHGAGLVHLLSLPPWAAVMELDTAPPPNKELEGEDEDYEEFSTSFETFSMWGGIEYLRLAENTGGRFHFLRDMPQCSQEQVGTSKVARPRECRRLKRASTSEVDLLAIREHVGAIGVRVLERKQMHASLRA